jgi:uncharacterized protein YbaR (Trm112 family)
LFTAQTCFLLGKVTSILLHHFYHFPGAAPSLIKNQKPMNSTFNSFAKSNHNDGIIEVAELLMNHGTSLSVQIDSSNYFEQAHDILCNNRRGETFDSIDVKFSSFRSAAFTILTMYYENVNPYDKRFYHIIDRLPVLIEQTAISADSTNQGSSFLEFIKVIANTHNTEMINYWNTMNNKIVSSISKVLNNLNGKNTSEKAEEGINHTVETVEAHQEAKKDPKKKEKRPLTAKEIISQSSPSVSIAAIQQQKQFLFSLLSVLFSSRIRCLFIPSIKQMKDLCLKELFFVSSSTSLSETKSVHFFIREFPSNKMSCYLKSLITTLSYIISLETIEFWNDTFHWVIHQMITLSKEELSLPLKMEIKESSSMGSSSNKKKEGNSSSSSSSSKQLPNIQWSSLISTKEKGMNKALILKNCFSTLCSLLNEMVVIGCSWPIKLRDDGGRSS